jgi:hypothetical protein
MPGVCLSVGNFGNHHAYAVRFTREVAYVDDHLCGTCVVLSDTDQCGQWPDHTTYMPQTCVYHSLVPLLSCTSRMKCSLGFLVLYTVLAE